LTVNPDLINCALNDTSGLVSIDASSGVITIPDLTMAAQDLYLIATCFDSVDSYTFTSNEIKITVYDPTTLT
jgi:hypothetical protein